MRLFDYLRDREWTPLVGYALFVTFLAAGYYYNVTFVQLGLLDLGTRLVGMTRAQVSAWMAALALLTFAVAVAVGVAMDRRGWSADLLVKLRLLVGVVALQFVLTLVAPAAGIPASFGLAVDLVPVVDRGYVAAAITAAAYFAANVYPLEWRIESFSAVMVAAMLPGLVA